MEAAVSKHCLEHFQAQFDLFLQEHLGPLYLHLAFTLVELLLAAKQAIILAKFATSGQQNFQTTHLYYAFPVVIVCFAFLPIALVCYGTCQKHFVCVAKYAKTLPASNFY
jgi:ABC-type polysaccharide/polyol phosphate export permease